LVDSVKDNVKLDLQDFHSYLYGVKYWPVSKKWSDISDYHPRPINYYNWIKNVLLEHIDIDLKINESDVVKIESEINKLKTMSECEIFFKNEYNELMNRKLTRGIYL
jgi:DNA-binding transcriptional regulator GbsR (MarR family)